MVPKNNKVALVQPSIAWYLELLWQWRHSCQGPEVVNKSAA